MSDSEDNASDHQSVEIVFQNVDFSSSDTSPEESVLFTTAEETNITKIAYETGLYNPGSAEICAKYITISDSTVLRHPYYQYPSLKDPGIDEALFGMIPNVIYADNGQEIYLDICKDMSIAPIKKFHTSLLTTKIDLSYYGLSVKGFRSIFIALRYNCTVKVLDLTDNWMNKDACLHLGEMLTQNKTITDLILNGCRIGWHGALALFHHISNKSRVSKLHLSKNQLTDKGIEYLAKAICKGAIIADVDLSHNNLTPKAILMLNEALEGFNNISHINLSWNNVVSSVSIYKLCKQIVENQNFHELNFAWNSLTGLRVGEAIKILVQSNENVRSIILNNNKLSGVAIRKIALGFAEGSNLDTLDLSCNPLSPIDALVILEILRNPNVKLRYLILDGVDVNEDFVDVCQDILSLSFRKNTVITYGNVRPRLICHPQDFKELLLKRVDAIGRSAKKERDRVDFSLLILELYREDPTPREYQRFNRTLKNYNLKLDDDLMQHIVRAFAGPKTLGKNKKVLTVDLKAIIDYIKRLWPEKKLPTPPPSQSPQESQTKSTKHRPKGKKR